jgi:hypothetical protein
MGYRDCSNMFNLINIEILQFIPVPKYYSQIFLERERFSPYKQKNSFVGVS